MGKGHEFVPTNLVGQSIPRLDAYEKVTGRARFTRDQTEPGMLYTKVLRSPHAHAWIRSIDTSEALQMYGVMEIIHCFNTTNKKFNWTNEPVQSPPYFQIVKDQCFFNREVRYVGDEVCAVAAISEEIAAEACKAIRVEYEVLPAVLTAEEAAAEDAPILHPDVNPKTNLAFKSENRTGDAEAAFAGCAAVVEGTYKMGVQKQMQLETQNALAWLAGDGRLTVWSPTQSPALVQRLVSWICEIPMSKVRVVNPGYVGGAFGVRIGLSSKAEIYAVELAKRTNRPVKFVYDRHEDMIASETRHGGQIHIRLGCDAGGCLQALEGRALMEGGAYALSSASLCGAVASRMQTVYHIPNVDYCGQVAYTNTTPAGAQRGYGAPQPQFAMENSINRLADAIGMDPVEFRKKNVMQPGDPWMVSYELRSTGMLECLDKGAREIGWANRKSIREGRFRRGYGVACGNHISSGYPFQIEHSNIFICMNYDGTIQFASGMMEMGTGLKTTLIQIAAEVLGTDPDHISAIMGDTNINVADMGAQASRGLYVTGHAVKNAAENLRSDMLRYAEKRLHMDKGVLRLKDSCVCDDQGKVYFTFSELAHDADDHMIQFSAIGKYISYNACPWHAHFAQVTVDTCTGDVHVDRLVAVHDVGRAINPDIVRGQIEGGVVMGLGYALKEEIGYSASGRQQRDGFHKYMVPVAADIGSVEAHIVESYEVSGPFGAKGVSESPVGTVAPAVAAAIHDATGVWLTETPMTPERVLFALRESRGGENGTDSH